MTPRQVVPALLVAFATAFLVILLGSGGESEAPVRDTAEEVRVGDALAEALRYLPADPEGVMTVQTDPGSGPLAAGAELVGELAIGDELDGIVRDVLGLASTTPAALGPLLGHPVVAAIPETVDLPAVVDESEEEAGATDEAARRDDGAVRAVFASHEGSGGIESDPELAPLPEPEPLDEPDDLDPLPPLDPPADLPPLDSGEDDLDEFDEERDDDLEPLDDLDRPDDDRDDLDRLDPGAGLEALGLPEIEGDVDPATLLRPLARRARLAWVTKDAAALAQLVEQQVGTGGLQRDDDVAGHEVYVREGGTSLAVRGPVLVVAPTPEDLRSALALRGEGAGGGASSLSAAELRDRVDGLPGPSESLVRLSVDREALLEAYPRLQGMSRATSWTEAVSRVAIAVVPGEDDLRLPYRVTTDEEDLSVVDVPIASGISGPNPVGEGRVLVSVRNFGHTLRAFRRALEAGDQKVAGQIDAVEGALRRFARVDLKEDLLDRLSGSATITTDDGALTLRSDLSDPKAVSDVLAKVARLLDVGDFVGGAGIDIDTGGFGLERDGDRYRLTKDGGDLFTLGVSGGALVVTTDPVVDLRSIADAAPAPADGTRGALFVRIAAAGLSDLVAATAEEADELADDLADVGELTLTAAGSAEHVEGELRLAGE